MSSPHTLDLAEAHRGSKVLPFLYANGSSRRQGTLRHLHLHQPFLPSERGTHLGILRQAQTKCRTSLRGTDLSQDRTQVPQAPAGYDQHTYHAHNLLDCEKCQRFLLSELGVDYDISVTMVFSVFMSDKCRGPSISGLHHSSMLTALVNPEPAAPGH